MRYPYWLLSVLVLSLSGCGGSPSNDSAPLPPVDTVQSDNSVVHGRAIVQVSNDQLSAMGKLYEMLMPKAYASIGTVTVTYTNSPFTTFAIDVSGLAPTFVPTMTGDTLNLGQVVISSLKDNNLKVCNPGGNTKCTQAIIRVYTTGSISGFVNTADSYGAPVYTGTLNPTTPLGLGSANSVQTELYTISSGTHAISSVSQAFPVHTYAVTSDFSNAGAGSYSMSYVVEYALAP